MKNTLISLEPKRIVKLTGIYNEPMSWKEAGQIILFIGIPFALIFATITTFL